MHLYCLSMSYSHQKKKNKCFATPWDIIAFHGDMTETVCVSVGGAIGKRGNRTYCMYLSANVVFKELLTEIHDSH